MPNIHCTNLVSTYTNSHNGELVRIPDVIHLILPYSPVPVTAPACIAIPFCRLISPLLRLEDYNYKKRYSQNLTDKSIYTFLIIDK